MVALRDGRKLIGVLRSWDQFGTFPPSHKPCIRQAKTPLLPSPANLVLQDTVERIFAHPPPASSPPSPSAPPRQPGLYADIKRGVFLVRGENVLLLGEIDLDRDDDPPPGYEPADVETVTRLADERKERDKVRDKARLRKLATLGFEGENMGEILL